MKDSATEPAREARDPGGRRDARSVRGRRRAGVDHRFDAGVIRRPEEYVAGAKILRRKIRRVKPEVVAFIGVTLFRSVFRRRPGQPVALGLQEEWLEGARVFVLPNPSGRNAHFSYADMLDAFVRLRRLLEK